MLTPISSAMNFVEISVLEMLSLMILQHLVDEFLVVLVEHLAVGDSKALIDDL